jgi:hypothetical protein
LTAAGAVADSGGRDSGAPAVGVERLARIVFAALVLACLAAFFVTQRLKHTPTAVQRFQLTPSFSPGHAGAAEQEHISFKLARADLVTVTILDSREGVVATLVSEHPVTRYKQFSLRWNGRRGTARRLRRLVSPEGHVFLVPENTGALAPVGEYRVGVTLHEQGRHVVSQRTFALVGG